MSQRWYIAQFNLARPLAPPDSPRLAEFTAALDRINALADLAPGFVWRLKGSAGNATDIRVAGDPELLINLSVWESIDQLFAFVYRSAHVRVVAQRRSWFERPTAAYQVLWWIDKSRRPTLEEAVARLSYLRGNGPSARAFTFKTRFPAPFWEATEEGAEPGAATATPDPAVRPAE